MCTPAGMCAAVSTRASMTTRCRAMAPPGLSCAAETVTVSWSTALGPSITRSQSHTPAGKARWLLNRVEELWVSELGCAWRTARRQWRAV
eukprot:scaffold74962_cov66-Phaeocystis_antarctica.AAC.1